MGNKFQTELRSKTWQQQMINDARHTGCLDLLGWCVEMRIGMGNVGVAEYPVGYVPYVPVGPDQELARDLAHLLLETFRLAGAPSATFGLALASLLDNPPYPVWYRWGDVILMDKVCADCGQVYQVDSTLIVAGSWVGGCCDAEYSAFVLIDPGEVAELKRIADHRRREQGVCG